MAETRVFQLVVVGFVGYSYVSKTALHAQTITNKKENSNRCSKKCYKYFFLFHFILISIFSISFLTRDNTSFSFLTLNIYTLIRIYFGFTCWFIFTIWNTFHHFTLFALKNFTPPTYYFTSLHTIETNCSEILFLLNFHIVLFIFI